MLDVEKSYNDTNFIVILAPTNYDSYTQHFHTSEVETVIELVLKYNLEAIMII